MIEGGGLGAIAQANGGGEPGAGDGDVEGAGIDRAAEALKVGEHAGRGGALAVDGLGSALAADGDAGCGCVDDSDAKALQMTDYAFGGRAVSRVDCGSPACADVAVSEVGVT